ERLVHGLAGGRHLLGYILARTARFDHFDQSAHLALNALEPVDDIALMFGPVARRGGACVLGTRHVSSCAVALIQRNSVPKNHASHRPVAWQRRRLFDLAPMNTLPPRVVTNAPGSITPIT